MRDIVIIVLILSILLGSAFSLYSSGYGKGKIKGMEATWTDAYNEAVSANSICDMKHRSLTPKWSVCNRKYFDEGSYITNNCVDLTIYCNGNFAP